MDNMRFKVIEKFNLGQTPQQLAVPRPFEQFIVPTQFVVRRQGDTPIPDLGRIYGTGDLLEITGGSYQYASLVELFDDWGSDGDVLYRHVGWVKMHPKEVERWLHYLKTASAYAEFQPFDLET